MLGMRNGSARSASFGFRNAEVSAGSRNPRFQRTVASAGEHESSFARRRISSSGAFSIFQMTDTALRAEFSLRSGRPHLRLQMARVPEEQDRRGDVDRGISSSDD